MTMINEIEMECPVCGKQSPQRVLRSTNTMGYPDLDLRPPEMQRSTMSTWLMECPHCGYVSGRFKDTTDITQDFLKTEKYLTCDGFEFIGNLSKRFYRAYLISEKSDDYLSCFFNLLHCAWDCDDRQDPNAAEIRKNSPLHILTNLNMARNRNLTT